MSTILGCGIATLDIVNRVDGYPPEDDEVRALDQQITPGGNASNTLSVLAALGHRCTLAATLSDEPDGARIRARLEARGIDCNACLTLPVGKVPTSYITLNRRNGSRTIVHHRDLPEYPADAFSALPLARYDWLHFEGRHVDALATMLTHAARTAPHAVRSLEIEKPRSGIERLQPLANVLLYSRGWAHHCGHQRPETFLAAATPQPGQRLFLAWGAEGAWLREADGQLHHQPALPLAEVADTLGAGDVFNAGVIDALARGLDGRQALQHGVTLAGQRCGMDGLDRFLAALSPNTR